MDASGKGKHTTRHVTDIHKIGFDVFLSHNSKDKDAVRRLELALRESGIMPWLDENELMPGQSWLQGLERGINESRAVAVLVGADGIGPWERPEMEAALDRATRLSVPVIPVLLPNAPEAPALPMFLGLRTWVDLRAGISNEGISKLIWGVTGQRSSDSSNASQSSRSSDLAVAQCIAYETSYAFVVRPEDSSVLPRDSCAIRRTLVRRDSESDMGDARGNKGAAHTISEVGLIAQLASQSIRRFWLVDRGGAGKTEFTKYCALRLAHAFIAAPATSVLPIRIEVNALDPAESCNGVNRLIENHLFTDQMPWIKEYLDGGRVAVILDGMDELRLDRKVFGAALTGVMERWPECTFVATSRGTAADLDLARPYCFAEDAHYCFAEVTKQQAVAHVRSVFALEQRVPSEAELHSLQDGNPLSTFVCETPLALSMATQVLLAGESLGSSPTRLFERGIELMLDRRRSRFAGSFYEVPEDDICWKALCCLAAHCLIDGLAETRASMSFARQDGVRWLLRHGESLTAVGLSDVSSESARRLVLQLVSGSGIVTWRSRESIVFTHRVIAEYCAARWICEEGYPNWPHKAHPYTMLANERDRQIADFFGDFYWSREAGGIRYWLLLLLQRHRAPMVDVLVSWQIRAAAVYGNAADCEAFAATEWQACVAPRVIGTISELQGLMPRSWGERTFDAIVDAVGFESIAMYAPQETLLRIASTARFQATLRCLCGSQNNVENRIASATLPHLLEMFEGVRDNDGTIVSVDRITGIASAMATVIVAERSRQYHHDLLCCVKAYLSKGCDIRALRDEVAYWTDALSPFTYWAILRVLVVAESESAGTGAWLHMLASKHDVGSPAAACVRAAQLLYAAAVSEAALTAETDSLCLESARVVRKGKRIGVLGTVLELLELPLPAIHVLCAAPDRLAMAGLISAEQERALVEAIVRRLRPAEDVTASAVERSILELVARHGIDILSDDLAMAKDPSSDLHDAACEYIRNAALRELADKGSIDSKKVVWLQRADDARFRELRDSVMKVAEGAVQTQEEARNWGIRIAASPECFAILNLPAETRGRAAEVLLQAALHVVKAGSGWVFWDEFTDAVPAWRQVLKLHDMVNSRAAESTHKTDWRVLRAMIDAIVAKSCDALSLAEKMVARMVEISIEKGGVVLDADDCAWLGRVAPLRGLEQLALLAMRVQCGTTLLGAHHIVQAAVRLWSDNASVREACLDLLRCGAGSVPHRSIIGQIARIVASGWPGDSDVARVLAGAGCVEELVQHESWAAWMFLPANRDKTGWLPDCVGATWEVAVTDGAERFALVCFAREAVRRGLPPHLIASAMA